MKQFFFSSSFTGNKAFNIGWFLFRFYIGITIAIGAGWPKMNELSAPGWFVKQVSELGFNFPSPAFWAAAASWGEFVGGICVAIGFFTRFSALQLTFQFFVISFIWYDKPMPMFGMYYQQLLFWGFVLISFGGSGKYAVDRIIMNRKNVSILPAVKPALAVLFLLIALGGFAQNKPLKGSGKTVTQTFAFNKFDKIDFNDLDGKIEIEVGKPFSISVTIDDNLQPLLSVTENDEVLKLSLKGNRNNRMYIEKTSIVIKISMPVISVLLHKGNTALNITGIAGRNLRIENFGNGNIVAKGSIDELEIICRSNGTVRAEALSAKKIHARVSGNGNVYINTDNTFAGKVSGNGNIINKGTGKEDAGSSSSGNGKIIIL